MLAPRPSIKGGNIVSHPGSHVGIRCKHCQFQRPRIVEYSASAFNQFGTRIVAGEGKGRGEFDDFVRKIIHNSTSYK